MGCCFSTPKTPNENPNHQNGLQVQKSPESISNSTREIDHRALPLPVEEETVKEVLSETPIPKPQVSILEEEKKSQMGPNEPRVENFEAKPKGVVEKAEEVSQLSEICSMSESFSTTTTITEKREEEATSKRWNRPPSSNAPRKRPYVGRERRAKSSPETKKIQGSARSVRGRESGQVATRKNNNVGPAGIRRDPGEGSARPSRRPRPPAKENGRDKNDDVPEEETVTETLDNPQKENIQRRKGQQGYCLGHPTSLLFSAHFKFSTVYGSPGSAQLTEGGLSLGAHS
ncbi:CLK4-associating serine/arginine rich protein-like [Senna tora]|uniref:CLK4-associating serine/arginine rich protein-like n=1 Tax=Senna tora TaxID=362788 RepID=A0A834SNI8_9FABA|nr:CLK4-associating serine/arginine rich protein-like [Senna tora]